MKNLIILCFLLLAPMMIFAQTYPLGDTNHDGTTDIVDALLIAQYYVNLNPVSFYPGEGDVDCQNGVDIVDALLIARLYVNIISSLPCDPRTPEPTVIATPAPTVNSGLPAPNTNGIAKPDGNPGNLKVINWAGFRGAVTYSFDDDNQSQITNYDRLNALGVPFTFYLWTNRNEARNSVWKRAVADGHEIGNHTASHQQNASGSDIDSATNFIKQNLGVTPYTMAAPYGNTSYSSPASSRFILNRGVNGGSIAPNDNSNAFNLPCTIPPSGASASTLNNSATSARNAGKWQIYCIHGFTGYNDGAYNAFPLQSFLDSVNYVKSLGDVWIGTAETIGAYWLGQKAISASYPNNSGGSIVYNWNLPSNFPPNKYVRVTVDGGQIYQNGNPVPWDSHGYYEISLDARSLTIRNE